MVLALANPHASHWPLISSAAVMADETNASIQSASPEGQQDGGFRGGRGGREGGGREGGGREGGGREGGGREGGGREGGGREPGGFRIRLSENEMRAARAIQEAFGLRSTVAALGLSLRTVAQLLEQGQLDEIVAATRAQAGAHNDSPRAEGRREPRGVGGGGGTGGGGRGERSAGNSRPNPFARPSKPAAVVEAPEEAPLEDEAAPEAPGGEDAASDLSSDSAADLATPATDSSETAATDQAPSAEAAAQTA